MSTHEIITAQIESADIHTRMAAAEAAAQIASVIRDLEQLAANLTRTADGSVGDELTTVDTVRNITSNLEAHLANYREKASRVAALRELESITRPLSAK